MSVIDDIVTSTKQTIAERLASPLLGSFVVAWCLWNYKFLVILFSAATVTQTFQLVETVAFPGWQAVLTRGVVFPLLTACAYIFLYPYPARVAYGFTLRRQREINSIRKAIEDETPLTLEESRQLRADFFAREQRSQEAIDRLNAEIARLKASQEDGLIRPELEEAFAKPSEQIELKSEPGTGLPTLSDSQLEMLVLLADAGGSATENLLVASAPTSKVHAEYDLGELQKADLVQTSYDSDGDRVYSFTHEGRKAVIDHQSKG